MRLWHEKLIPLLPRQQLLGQHRECCALRGNGWGKPHATVNYVFEHHPMYLVVYHHKVMREMRRRKYNVAEKWWDIFYRGEHCEAYSYEEQWYHLYLGATSRCNYTKAPVYPEHDDQYLKECLDNLERKGIPLEV